MNIKTHKDAVLAEALGMIGEMDKSINQAIERVDVFKNEIEAITETWANENLTRAENILNASLIANKNAIDRQITESLSKELIKLKTILKPQIEQINSFKNQIYIITAVNLIFLLGSIAIFVVR